MRDIAAGTSHRMKFHVGVQLPVAAVEGSPIYPSGCRVHAVYPIALEIGFDQ